MKVKYYAFAVITLCFSMYTYAENQKTTIPTELVIKKDKIYIPESLIQVAEKYFDFDWEDTKTIERNQNKLNEMETFLRAGKYSIKTSKEEIAFGKLLFKLGSFYTHILHSPDRAIEKMKLAEKFLQDKQDLGKNNNHLAFAYEQKYEKSQHKSDKEQAFYYINQVLTKLHPDAKNENVAFAYCVKGLIQNQVEDYVEAEKSFKQAIEIYDSMPQVKNDTYMRAKNKFASIILYQQGRDHEAIAILASVKNYWLVKIDAAPNIYSARNALTLGLAHLKLGNAKAARNDLNETISLFNKTYGIDSKRHVILYECLADTYAKLGDDKLVEYYLQQADKVDKE